MFHNYYNMFLCNLLVVFIVPPYPQIGMWTWNKWILVSFALKVIMIRLTFLAPTLTLFWKADTNILYYVPSKWPMSIQCVSAIPLISISCFISFCSRMYNFPVWSMFHVAMRYFVLRDNLIIPWLFSFILPVAHFADVACSLSFICPVAHFTPSNAGC